MHSERITGACFLSLPFTFPLPPYPPLSTAMRGIRYAKYRELIEKLK
jgi:hypothetical protein